MKGRTITEAETEALKAQAERFFQPRREREAAAARAAELERLRSLARYHQAHHYRWRDRARTAEAALSRLTAADGSEEQPLPTTIPESE
ncbi:hypothetical protein ACQ3I4_11225 [Zafaria sp. Z1313]|uniref:hypothetical protein n=1 Tax=Zafaria sp. Z1313 TaxID=3423202 RepID=UPI003D301A39